MKNLFTKLIVSADKIINDYLDKDLLYYNKINDCKASSPNSSNCICWHKQGSGPYPKVKPNNEEGKNLTWDNRTDLKKHEHHKRK